MPSWTPSGVAVVLGPSLRLTSRYRSRCQVPVVQCPVPPLFLLPHIWILEVPTPDPRLHDSTLPTSAANLNFPDLEPIRTGPRGFYPSFQRCSIAAGKYVLSLRLVAVHGLLLYLLWLLHWPGRTLRADRLVLKHGKVERWYDLALCVDLFSCRFRTHARRGSGLFGVVVAMAWRRGARGSSCDCKTRWDILKVDEDGILVVCMEGPGLLSSTKNLPCRYPTPGSLLLHADVEQPTRKAGL
jgi:hypothetical protein